MESDGAVTAVPDRDEPAARCGVSNGAVADRSSAAPPILSLRGVSKRYPGVVALDGVDLDVYRGEIHAVVGENGAGKSTLIKIITGVIDSDAGEIRAGGAAVEIGSPHNAGRIGIAAVPQEILVVPELPIGRNILLGMESALTRRGALDAGEAAVVGEALKQVGANFAPDTPTRRLSIPQLRLAQIARALVQSGEIIVLDEPTAVLSEPDAEHLLERLVAFRDGNKAIIYITHRLNEVMRIADRVTVLRDGKWVGHFPRGGFDRSNLLTLMAKADQSPAGGGPDAAGNPAPVPAGVNASASMPPRLAVLALSAEPRFADVTFSAGGGEIVGLAGVQGSGHGHVLRAIAGVDARDAGSVRLSGAELAPGSPAAAFRSGLLFIPADRRGAGIVASRTIRENIALSPLISSECRWLGFRLSKRERAITLDQMKLLSIQARSPEVLTGRLSGGNQQKVVLARVLSGDVQVLLIEEPTQGIDVRSRMEIHAILRRLAKEQKCTVIIASSEFEELIELADVVHVLRLGRLAATFSRENVSYQKILHAALP